MRFAATYLPSVCTGMHDDFRLARRLEWNLVACDGYQDQDGHGSGN